MGIDDEAARLLAQLAAEDGVTVSVGLFGQPGAGKSSLINALVGADVAAVGVRTDTTTGREEYAWNGLTLVDLPGYGTARFPAGDYVARFDVLGFDLLLCVFDGKFRQADTDLFREVTRAGKVTLFVRTKHDSLFQPGRTTADLERDVAEAVAAQVGSAHPVYFTSAKDGTGLGPLAAAVGDALAPAKRDRWVRAARAYTRDFLDAKKAVCERRVSMAAGLAAVGGGAAALAPIPGTNLLVDVPVLLKLFQFIRDTYGLADTASLAARAAPVVGPAVNSVVRYATTDGVVALLGQFAGRQAAQTAARVVPFVGPLIAGGIGYALVSRAGRSYLDDSHRVAEAILEREVHG